MSYAVVYNPRSGKKKKLDLKSFFKEKFIGSDFELFIWDQYQSFEEIEKKIQEKNFNVIVAAGGDGTVNKVASFAMENDHTLGIVPLGSGNGLARSLKIELDIDTAVEKIKKGKVDLIDSGKINEQIFFCTAGVGFDAHISKLFASTKKRGFWTYFKITAKELLSYQTNTYEVKTDESTKHTDAFLITACNAGQWGNDIYIAPEASMKDGVLNLVVVKKFPWYTVPFLAYKLLTGKIQESKYVCTLSSKSITIKSNNFFPSHYDGEPGRLNNEVNFRIGEKKLKVIC
ncbi:MAG: diacylglycerol/lipid kinase family protein [Bacteroidota bacterium]|jgi:diacylglycerol kinase (ATP)